jgi:hypothetical protein
VDCIGQKNLVGQRVFVCSHLDGGEGGPVDKFVLCEVHNAMRNQQVTHKVKGWAPESFVNDGGMYEDDIEAARQSVRKSLGMSMGRKPVCTKCGGEIDLADKNFIVSGLERLHLTCPGEDEIKRTPRYFALAAPERLPVLFCSDPEQKRAYSFLFKLDRKSKEEALEKHRLEPVRIRYVPDTEAYAAATREIKEVNADDFSIFDQKRQFKETRHPVTGADGYTRYDRDLCMVVSQLFKEEGGVVHGMSTAFACDINEKSGTATVTAAALEITFELKSQAGYVSKMTEQPLLLEDDFVQRISNEFK